MEEPSRRVQHTPVDKQELITWQRQHQTKHAPRPDQAKNEIHQTLGSHPAHASLNQ